MKVDFCALFLGNIWLSKRILGILVLDSPNNHNLKSSIFWINKTIHIILSIISEKNICFLIKVMEIDPTPTPSLSMENSITFNVFFY